MASDRRSATLLVEEWPQAWHVWRDLGAEPVEFAAPDASALAMGVRSRRSTYERALRRAAGDVDGLTVATGRVERLLEETGRVVGAVVDGAPRHADLVIDASGRLSRFAGPPEIGADAGMAYVSRTFRRMPTAPPGPMASPFAWSGRFHGYDGYVFPHEHGHLSVVLIRPTADADFAMIRHVEAFEAACAAILAVAEWTDPAVATPTSGVLAGGQLLNLYRPQLRRRGLLAVGDAVATTAPTAGRGLAMASMQIRALLDLLDAGVDPTTIAEPFGAWCDGSMRPWVEDHIAFDAESVRRWQGHDIDLTQPLTSAAIVAAAQADPTIAPLVRAVPRHDCPTRVAHRSRTRRPRRLHRRLAPTDNARPNARPARRPRPPDPPPTTHHRSMTHRSASAPRIHTTEKGSPS